MENSIQFPPLNFCRSTSCCSIRTHIPTCYCARTINWTKRTHLASDSATQNNTHKNFGLAFLPSAPHSRMGPDADDGGFSGRKLKFNLLQHHQYEELAEALSIKQQPKEKKEKHIQHFTQQIPTLRIVCRVKRPNFPPPTPPHTSRPFMINTRRYIHFLCVPCRLLLFCSA